MTWVSPNVYASSRGVTKQAVLKAIKTGRLIKSVKKNDQDKWEVNPEAADLEWEANTDKSKQNNVIRPERPAVQTALFYPDHEMPLTEARRMKEQYNALLAKLQFDLDSGKYVDTETVSSEWFKIVTAAKTKLLALPSKAKANLPHLTPSDIDALDRIVREALEDLSHELN